MNRYRRWVVSAIVIPVTVGVVGCSGGSTNEASSSVDPACAEDWPTRVAPSPEAAEEVEFLDDIAVCASSDGSSFLFTNNSDVVWYFADDGGGSYTPYPGDEVSEWFRAEVAPVLVTYDFMAPGDQVVAQYPTLNSAASAHWYIERGLSTALTFQTIFKDQVVDLMQDSGVAIFGKGSPARRAVGTCAVAGYNTGVLLGEDSQGLNSDTLGAIADDVGCLAAWRAAEKASSGARFPTVNAAISEAAEAGERLALWTKLGEYIGRGCRILPKC